MVEFYQAYADYRELMDLTEEMLRTVTQDVLGTSRVHYQGTDLDFSKPFHRMTVVDSILHFNPTLTAEGIATLR